MRKITSLLASLLMFVFIGANAQQVYTVTYSSKDPDAGAFYRGVNNDTEWSKVTSGFAKRWESNGSPKITITAAANNYNPANFGFYRGINRQPNTVTIETKYKVVSFSIQFRNILTDQGSDGYGPHNQTLIVGTDTVTAIGTESATVTGKFEDEPVSNFVFEFAAECSNTGALIDAFVINYIDNVNYGRDYMEDLISKKPFDESKYPVGDKPGQYPEEYFDKVFEAWDYILEYQADENASSEDCLQASLQYEAALEELLAHQNKVSLTEGYYYIVSAKEPSANEPLADLDATENLLALYSSDAAYNSFAAGFNVEVKGEEADPKYIYQVKFVTDSTFNIINVPFKKYLKHSTGYSYVTLTENVSDAAEYMVITDPNYPGFAQLRNNKIELVVIDGKDKTQSYWEIYSSASLANNSLQASNTFLNAFRFYPVSEETVAAVQDKIQALNDSVDQVKRNTKLTSLINTASETREKGRTFTAEGGTFDGAFPLSSGLIQSESQVASNIEDPGEGSIEGLFDGVYNGNSFFHTSWRQAAPAKEEHFIQLDLGEAVQTLLVKMAKRTNSGNDIPYGISLYGTNDASLAAFTADSLKSAQVDSETGDTTKKIFFHVAEKPTSDWGDPLTFAQMDWSYPLLNSEGAAVTGISGTRTSAPIVQGAGLVTFEMPKACRYVRLVVNTTVASVVEGKLKTNGDGFNFWNASELRAYKAALDSNCVYEHMDQNVKDELDAAIAAAKAEVAAKTSTQATIDRLQNAIDAFNAVYPDINKLKEAIKNAQAFADSASVGTDLSQVTDQKFIDELLAACTSANDVAGKSVLYYEDFKKAMETLEAGLEAFGKGVVEPADGYYFVKSLSIGAPGGNYMVAKNSGNVKDDYSKIQWGYKDATDMGDRLNAQWELKKVGEHEFTLRNAGTNLYLSNDTTSLSMPLYQSSEPYTFKLRFGRYEGAFNIVLDTDLYANASPGAGVIVTWNSAMGPDNSAFKFEKVPSFDAAWKLDVNGESVNIVTMPFDVDANGDVTYYQVKGQSSSTIELEAVSGATIPAGTPFIIAPNDASVTTTNIYTSVSSRFADIVYVTGGAQTVNGLVGALNATTIDSKGFIFYNDSIVVANNARRQAIAANTGYFDLHNMPQADKNSGALSLPKSNEVVTEIVEVQNNVANKQDGVYTIQGIRLNKTVNLPKGVYIINGRKVVKK